jgi:6-phosphogluconolactonase
MGQATMRRLLATCVAAGSVVTGSAQAAVTQFVYLTNYVDNTLSAYRLDADTGALEAVPGSPFATDTHPAFAVVEPSNRFLYVLHRDATILSGYAIGPDGGLAALPGSPFLASSAGAADLTSLAVDISGRFLYATDAVAEKVRGYRIDGATGALTTLPASPFALGNNADALSVHPSGRFLYAAAYGGGDGVWAYTIDPSTGALARVAGTPVGAGDWPRGSAVDPSGRFLYVANASSGDLSAYSIAPNGAAIPFIGSAYPAGDSPRHIAITPSGDFLYVANRGSANISAWALDGTTGELAALADAPFAAGSGADGLTMDASGRFLYAANASSANVSGYSISPTGVLTPIAGSPFVAGAGASAIVATSDRIFRDGFE